MATIRVLSAEGEAITWPRAVAAEQSNVLQIWIERWADGGGAFDTRDPAQEGSGIPAQALRALAAIASSCGGAFPSGDQEAGWAVEDCSVTVSCKRKRDEDDR